MKNYLLSFLTFFFVISCNQGDKEIKHHFKKFILINNLKDYEIEEIVRRKGDTITEQQNKINKVLQEIAQEKRIINDSNWELNKNKDELKSNPKFANYFNYQIGLYQSYIEGSTGRIKELKQQLDIEKNKINNNIYCINSLIKIKGMTASGEKFHEYLVIQNKDGGIKSVYQIK